MTHSSTYYDRHAIEFFQQTVHVDISELRRTFTDLLPRGGRILDAGCGSGRDAKAFAEQGFVVTAFDASVVMAELASRHAGLPVQILTFQELSYQGAFDGIWACASLLHVPIADEEAVFQKLVRALRGGGILYVSYKVGAGERVDRRRLFRDHTTASLEALVARFPQLRLLSCRQTSDLRPGRTDTWINGFIQKHTG